MTQKSNSETANANYANLTYGITEVASADECTAEATGTPIVSAGTALDATGDPASMQLTAGAEGEAGAPLTLCFQVTADDGLTEDTTTNATWQFTGTSVE